MSLGLISLILLGLAIAGYMVARTRAVATAGGDARRLHSLPAFHGRLTAMSVLLPSALILVVWLLMEGIAIRGAALSHLDASNVPDGSTMDLIMSDVGRIASGLALLEARGVDIKSLLNDPAAMGAAFKEAGVAQGGAPTPDTILAAQAMREAESRSRLAMSIVAIAAGVVGMLWVLRKIQPEFRARNATERVSMGLLIGASLIAVGTTIGIVLSLLSETLHFFQLYDFQDFFFSTVWNPKFTGGSDLGIWPLIWGTIYVSVIALAVAVPIGLFSAIYLAEYASKRTRAYVKPLIEILAGIPTIVYGLFALVTVGPLLRDWISIPMGFGNSSSSVMTAGLVMGIMVIPFVSSLSDDIINAVPQSLRDGSLGLGATPSETIRQVVLPAALPGIVGAVLLAASRAIGETMIVVLGAGAAAQLSLNPFDAMTTVTVKIVSQLTGDTEFNSPETLVAFALGLTLFTLTLGLNIVALVIVRKYREQYE